MQPHLAHLVVLFGFFFNLSSAYPGIPPQTDPAFLGNSQILHPPTGNCSQHEYCEVVCGGRCCAAGPGTRDEKVYSGCGRGEGGGCVLALVSCKMSRSRFRCEPARCLQRTCDGPSVSRLPLDGEPTAEPRVDRCWSRRNVLLHLKLIPDPCEGPRSHGVEDCKSFVVSGLLR